MRWRPDLRTVLAGLVLAAGLAGTAAADVAERMRTSTLAGSERLRLRAFGQALAAGQAPPAAVAQLRRDMVGQGFYHAGRPAVVARQVWVAPVLAWDGNINGGVPRDSFWFGGLLFQADPAFRAQAGVVAGVAAGGTMRLGWAEGRVVDLTGRVELAWSPDHDIGRADAGLALCSLNHVAGWTFVDLCASASRSWRDLGITGGHQVSVALAQVVSTPGALHQLGLRYARADTPAGGQDRLTLSVESVHDRMVTDLAVTLGAAMPGTTALRQRVEARLAWHAAGRAWRADLSHQTAEGGLFLGAPRHDRGQGIGLSVAPRPGATLRLGYATTRSTAGFADHDQITLDLRLDGLRW